MSTQRCHLKIRRRLFASSVVSRVTNIEVIFDSGSPIIRPTLSKSSAIEVGIQLSIIFAISITFIGIRLIANIILSLRKVGPFAKTIHWADVDAIGVLAVDTGFGNDVCHGRKLELTVDRVMVPGLF